MMGFAALSSILHPPYKYVKINTLAVGRLTITGSLAEASGATVSFAAGFQSCGSLRTETVHGFMEPPHVQLASAVG
jgi:hypothetical protein